MSENNPMKKIIAEEQAKAKSHLQQAKANIGELLKQIADEETKKKFEGLASQIDDMISKM